MGISINDHVSGRYLHNLIKMEATLSIGRQEATLSARRMLLVMVASRIYTRHYFTRFQLLPEDAKEVSDGLHHALQTHDMFGIQVSYLSVVPQHKRFELSDDDYKFVRLSVAALIEASLAEGGRSLHSRLVALNSDLMRIRAAGIRTKDAVFLNHIADQFKSLAAAAELLVRHNESLHALCNMSDLLVSGRKNTKRRRMEEQEEGDDDEEEDEEE